MSSPDVDKEPHGNGHSDVRQEWKPEETDTEPGQQVDCASIARSKVFEIALATKKIICRNSKLPTAERKCGGNQCKRVADRPWHTRDLT